MGMSMDGVSAMLSEAGIVHVRDAGDHRELIRAVFETDYYVDYRDGQKSVGVLIALEEDGEYLKIVAPAVYRYRDGPHKAAVFQTLLEIGWRSKMLGYRYDGDSGEIRAGVEVCVEDGLLTRRQLERMVRAIAKLVDDFHYVVSKAMAEGVVDFSREMNRGEMGG